MAASIRHVSFAAKNMKNVLYRAPALTFSRIIVAHYAKKIGGGKMGMKPIEKVTIEVEKDSEKLTQFCCGANIYLDGKDPEIKADSEYPDWLWELRTERGAVDLKDMEYDTHEYWKRLRKLAIKRQNRLLGVNPIKR